MTKKWEQQQGLSDKPCPHGDHAETCDLFMEGLNISSNDIILCIRDNMNSYLVIKDISPESKNVFTAYFYSTNVSKKPEKYTDYNLLEEALKTNNLPSTFEILSKRESFKDILNLAISV